MPEASRDTSSGTLAQNMPIPDYQACMLPLLRFAANGQEHQLKDAISALAGEFSLSEEERNEFLPSGQQPVFTNRVGWARTYLKKAGLLSSPRRGYFQITDRGRTVLKDNPKEINQKYLERFPEFIEFKSIRRDKTEDNASETPELTLGQTPHEALDIAYERLRAELAAEILTESSKRISSGWTTFTSRPSDGRLRNAGPSRLTPFFWSSALVLEDRRILEFPLSMSPREVAKILQADGWFSLKTTIYHIEYRVRRLREKGHPETSRRSKSQDNAKGRFAPGPRRSTLVTPILACH